MQLEQTLTKENFWNEMMQQYPKATKEFCDWIDEYKKAVGWNGLFGQHETKNHGRIVCMGIAPKFHDIPHAMQQGIWIEFIRQNLHNFFEQPEYTYSGDLEEDIKTVFGELEPLIEVEETDS